MRIEVKTVCDCPFSRDSTGAGYLCSARDEDFCTDSYTSSLPEDCPLNAGMVGVTREAQINEETEQ